MCTCLLQIGHGVQHRGQETRVKVALCLLEVVEGGLTFGAGPRESARQSHFALNLRKVRLFLVTYLS